MACWVFCNRCFQPPQGTTCFSLTNCGHVYCDVCLRKGKRNECLICKVPCRTVLLSKHTDSDIQSLFMGIDGLCRKYARETSQVSEFQEKHRRRLLAYYREKISHLEESLRKSALRMEQLQSVRLSQQTAFSTTKNPVSTPSTKPNGPLFLPPDSSASERAESMEVDLRPSPRRKCEVATGLTRISLLSPPRDGRMVSPPCAPTVMLLCGSVRAGAQASLRQGSLSVLSFCGKAVPSQFLQGHTRPCPFLLLSTPDTKAQVHRGPLTAQSGCSTGPGGGSLVLPGPPATPGVTALRTKTCHGPWFSGRTRKTPY
ncbi:probable E3 SUMO-protein ligase RNF212 [Mesoplodon densirostris]|uniref:probable E3 SUMO-protein ligase RNF212 n=1 Tax=Mesoplodon densirostris TaxID=48708 RepID=UPI0028DBADE9|nr:probable E3 SUMO-protein ligase RNF212 [Mesoplodon densirostris]